MTTSDSDRPPRAWQRIRDARQAAGIALGLDRVHACWQEMPYARLAAPVCITVAGTNGKGSTVALLRTICAEAGWRAGVYTSPHLVRFHERIVIAGQEIDDQRLDALYQEFDAPAARHRLTQFELDTLVALAAIWSAGVDVAILEVGMGGRLDATNLIDADCAVITSVDVDHVEFLGPDREAIGREKAGIMRAGRPVVVSDPVPPQSVIDHAQEIGADLWRFGEDFNYSGDKQQWAWAGRGRRYAGLAYPALRGANQLLNASGALAALEAVRDKLPVTAQAVRLGLAHVELAGRMQIVPGEPTLVLDVAHNPHAVAALAANLIAMGYFPTTHAVFGAMHDKDLAQILEKIGPLIDRWYFCDLPTPRAQAALALQRQWQQLQAGAPAGTPLPPRAEHAEHGQAQVRVPAQVPAAEGAAPAKASPWRVVSRSKEGVGSAGAAPRQKTSSAHADPAQALAAALEAAMPADRIVVFGSFYTVGGVLQHGLPRLLAKHLGA